MAVLIGLDFGIKRIGVAVTDESATMALPLETIEFKSRQYLLEQLKRLIKEYRAGKIVAGLPKTMSGEIGPAAKKVMENVDWLRPQVGVEIVMWDERLTTREIERILLEADVNRAKRKEVRDQLAAQRILQTYMDYEKAQGR